MAPLQDEIVVQCVGEEATRRLGRRLGGRLEPGSLVGLVGALGAGKTVFVQGLAQGLGVPGHVRVRSPTYAYVHEYEGRLTLLHVDLYRVDTVDDLEAIGYRELYEPAGVCAVEWFDRVPEARPPAYLLLTFEDAGADTNRRSIVLESVGGCGAGAISDL